MIELVSGWVDRDTVHLVERHEDATTVRAIPAKWTAFFLDLDDSDRGDLQRMRQVIGLQPAGRYTRVDFRNRWDRRDICERIQEGARRSGQPAVPIMEADVNPLRRFLSDSPNHVVSPTPRLGWFDIETDSRKTFSQAREGMARVLSWAFLDHQGREHWDWLRCDTDAAERYLIEGFLTAARETDVLLAWNGDNFDFPVITQRATHLDCRPRGRTPQWNRWCWLDHLEVFRKYNMHAHESGDEKASFKLQDVSMHLLGEGKDDFDARYTWEAWLKGGESRRRMMTYNRKDTALLPRIEAKTGYVALHLAVCHITGCLPDTRSLMASQQGDGFLLKLGAQHGHRWPTKHEHIGTPYKGAYVMEPTRLGIIEDVHVADFASLYPSIIRTLNMSPETMIPVDAPEPQGGVCRLPFEQAPVKFTMAKRGMLPLALDQLVTKRGEYTRKADAADPGSAESDHYKRLSSAFKIVANSFYGIVGSNFTRFFCRDVAEGVTKTGAWLIHHVADRAKCHGLDPFYGDTDSIFAAGRREDFEAVVNELNGEWATLARQLGATECHFKLEFEKTFRRLVLVTAKRYAGAFSVYKGKPVSADKKPEVKGLEYKRGDAVRIARLMQRELIGMLLGPAVPPVEELQAFVQRWQDRVLTGDLTIEDVVVSQSVKALGEYAQRYSGRACKATDRRKVRCGYDFGGVEINGPDKCPKCGTARDLQAQPAHVRVATVLAARGEEIREGTRVAYLVVGRQGTTLDAVPATDPGALERIDRRYYWDNRIYPASARVLAASFPDVGWVETSQQRKARVFAERCAANKGKIDDLPLFAGFRS